MFVFEFFRLNQAEPDNVKLRRLEDEIRTLKDRSSRADISVGEKTRLEAKFKQLEREKFDIQLQCDYAVVDDGHSVPHEMVGEKTVRNFCARFLIANPAR